VIPVTSGRVELASSLYMELIERMAETLAGLPLRGQQLERQGRLAEAAEVYRESVRQEPGRMTARVRLGLVLRHLGRDEEANEVFREVLALHLVDVE